MPNRRDTRHASLSMFAKTVIYVDHHRRNQRTDLFRNDEACTCVDCHTCGSRFRIYYPTDTDNFTYPNTCTFCGDDLLASDLNPEPQQGF